MNRPGYTVPPITMLKNLPYIAQAGSVFATDQRGSGTYVYGLTPNPTPTGVADMAFFYRYAIGRDGTPVADSWQQLATPAWTATETIDSGASMIVDATSGLVYLITADSVGGVFHRFRVYTPATNAWANASEVGAALEATANPPVSAITNAALAHPCLIVSPAVALDDFIYLSIGNVAQLKRYAISTGTWTDQAVRGGVPGLGSTLTFVPSEPDHLYGLRGGATATFDRYTISGGGAWNSPTLIPATETFTTGAEATAVRGYPGHLLVHRNGRILDIEIGNPAATPPVIPIASLEGADGSPHAGSGIVAYAVGTKIFVAVRKHSGVEFQRIELVL